MMFFILSLSAICENLNVPYPLESFLRQHNLIDASSQQHLFIPSHFTTIAANDISLESSDFSLTAKNGQVLVGSVPKGSMLDLVNSTISLSAFTISPDNSQAIAQINLDSTLSIMSVIFELPSIIPTLFSVDGGRLSLINTRLDTIFSSTFTQPLAVSTAPQTIMTLSQLHLTGARLGIATPYLFAGPVGIFSLEYSHISNVSLTSTALGTAQTGLDNTANLGQIIGTEISFCESPYTGGLYNDDSHRSHLTLNSSFAHSTALNTGAKETIQTIKAISDTRYTSITNAADGGAIIVTNSATATFTRCEFISCKATGTGRGGAIFADTGNVIVLDCLFDSCAGVSGGAIAVTEGALTVTDATFISCEATIAKSNIHYDGLKPEDGPGNVVEHGGGAIIFFIKKDLKLVNVQILGCHAKAFGGGITLCTGKNKTAGYLRLYSLLFIGTDLTEYGSSGNSQGGANIFFTETMIQNHQTHNFFNPKDVLGVNADGTPHLEDIFTDYLNHDGVHSVQNSFSGFIDKTANHTLGDLVVSTSGLDNPLCSDNPKCRTLTYTSKKSNKDAKIAVEEGTFGVTKTESGFDVTSRKLVITGSGKANTIVKLSKPDNRMTSFSVSSGELDMKKMAFSLEGAVAGLELTVFHLNGEGSLILSECDFTGSANVLKSRFIVVQKGTLQVTKCDFSSLTSTCTHGLAINASLQGNHQILIDTCVFTSIKPQSPVDLSQSAVLLHIEGDKTNYQLQSLKFSGGATNKGSDILFACYDVEPVLIRSHCRFSFKDNEEDNRRFHVKTGKKYEELYNFGIPWYFSKQTLFISATGDDNSQCKTAETACKSINRAEEVVGSLFGYTINVHVSAELKKSVNATDTTFTSSADGEVAAIDMSSTSAFQTGLFPTEGVTVCSELTFLLDTSKITKDDAVFVVSKGAQVTLESCVLEGNSKSNADSKYCTLVRVTEGELHVTDLTVSGFNFLAPLFSIADASIMTIEGSRIEGVQPEKQAKPSNADDDVCSWETGLISAVSSTITVSSSHFSQVLEGVFSLKSSTLNLATTSFDKNVIDNSSFPSLQRNVHCTESTINLNEDVTVVQNSNAVSPSLWFAGDCEVVSTTNEVPKFLFFNPTVKKPTKVGGLSPFAIQLTGTELIPCGLNLRIQKKASTSEDSNAGEALDIPLPIMPTKALENYKHNETSIEFAIYPNEMNWTLGEYEMVVKMKEEVIGVFDIFKHVNAKFTRKALNTLLWALIPSLIVLLIIAIIIIVCCCRSRNKKKNNDSEMAEEQKTMLANQSSFNLQSSSDDVTNPLTAAGRQQSAAKARAFIPVGSVPLLVRDRAVATGGMTVFSVPCVVCDGSSFPFSYADCRQQLYGKIHSTDQKTEGSPEGIGVANQGFGVQAEAEKDGEKDLNKRILTAETGALIVKQVSGALKYLVEQGNKGTMCPDTNKPYPPFNMNTLSSRSILLYPNNQVLIVLPESYARAAGLDCTNYSTMQSEKTNNQDTFEERRWYAPEIESDKTQLSVVKASQATVFSVGLVLFEILAGEIPFGEVDSLSAQRRIQSGAEPMWERALSGATQAMLQSDNAQTRQAGQNAADSQLTEICRACIQHSPDDRISLVDLFNSVSKYA
ncbi:hypothetical protein BLNAU_12829 [Blattamonas nauphoetae]|uniref:Protein kinase domain-containing protein n=1 Tax=Blattamonas nauphoetae TaxID=2049346 RepID=A0ABQ9XQ89_9EUKA|nr:hypothetical protein BLNAU_12829 [Blattamonas nauphoetae]